MFSKNWINESRMFGIIILLFSGCIEDKSIVFNPEDGESYELVKFDLEKDLSFSFRQDDFSAGSSSRLYLGRNNNEIKSYILLKLKKELFYNDAICTQENFNNINTIYLKIPSITDLDEFVNYNPDSTQIYDNSYDTYPDNQIKAYILNDDIDDDFENISSIHEIDFFDIENIQQNTTLPVNVNNIFNHLSIDLRGYLYSEYESIVTNNEIECSNLSYDDCICSLWDGDSCLQINDDCYWNSPVQNIEGNYCFNEEYVQFQTAIDNWCNNESNDVDILLEFTNADAENDIIEFYSTDNSNVYNSPYVYINYDIIDSELEYINKYQINSINSDYLESANYASNINSDSNQMGMVLGIDSSILTYVDLNNENNLDCTEVDCSIFESNPIITQDYEDILFDFEFTLDDEYIDLYDEIDFYFNSVYFVYKELDPSGDNWEDCGTDGDCSIIDEDGTQENLSWDLGENQEGNYRWDYNDINEDDNFDILTEQYELFDDYGLDLCPDENESGNGNCDEENSLYNSEGLENNNQWDQSDEGDNGDGICEKYECEFFNDYGFDHINDDYESGCFSNDNLFGSIIQDPTLTYEEILAASTLDISQNDIPYIVDDVTYYICGEYHWLSNCSTCTVDDPNGDNYNIDPSKDDWNDCGTDGDCDVEDVDGTQDNDSWDLGEGTENNGQYDSGEVFFDYGLDGLPDIYENFDYDVDDDNWNDCGTDGDCDVEDLDGTQDNDSWDLGEGTEGNGIWEVGEPYFDYGIDQLLSYQETGFNPSGKENNLDYDYYNTDYSEYFEDYGLDQCINENELGNDDCCDTEDCEIVLEEFDDPNNDNYLIDPNLDNYDVEDNDTGTENNGILNSNEDLTVSEQYYDYGYDHTINHEENNYYGNTVDLALGSNLYTFEIPSNDYDENSEAEITTFIKPSFTISDNLGLWISSIQRINQNTYRLSINVHSMIDITAFQFQLKHIPFSNEIESIEDRTLYLFSPEFDDNNSNYFPETSEIIEDGEKYILDSSIYTLPDLCEFNAELPHECVNSDNNFNILYGYGSKVSMDFLKNIVNVDEENSLESFINENQNSNISNEFTNLVLYFDKSENSTHDVEESSNIIIEYIDENFDYVLFDNINLQNVSSEMDSIKINVGSLIQKYINNEIIYNGVILSSSSTSYNFSNISIIYDEFDATYNPRLEIFYSK